MKKLILPFLTIAVIVSLSFKNGDIHKAKIIHKPIKWGEWGEWKTTNCYIGLDFRVKKTQEDLNFNGKYEWEVQFRNRYADVINFNYKVADPGYTGQTIDRIAVSANSTSSGNDWGLITSSSECQVLVDKMRFGKDDDDSKPYLLCGGIYSNSSTGNSSNNIPAGTNTASNNNLNEAISLKTDLDTTRTSFNQNFSDAYDELSKITVLQQKEDYWQKLDSCKAAFNSTYQQTTQYYSVGNGQNMKASLVNLHTINSRTRYYISLMGDLVVREGKPFAQVNTSGNSTGLVNNNASSTQGNNTTNTNQYGDAIQQALQLNLAKANLTYSATHGGNPGIILQQQQQVNQLQQQQNAQNAAAVSNAVTSITNILSNAAANSNDKKEKADQVIDAYNENHAAIDNQIENTITLNPNDKFAYYNAALSYIKIADNVCKVGDDYFINTLGSHFPQESIDLYQIAIENYEKAVAYFNGALKIDSNFYDANRLIAFSIIRKVSLKQDLILNHSFFQKNLNKDLTDEIAQAQPYLLKALTLKPRPIEALRTLQGYYEIIKDKKNEKEVKNRIKELD